MTYDWTDGGSGPPLTVREVLAVLAVTAVQVGFWLLMFWGLGR